MKTRVPMARSATKTATFQERYGTNRTGKEFKEEDVHKVTAEGEHLFDAARYANQQMDILLQHMSPAAKRNLHVDALNAVCLFLERCARSSIEQLLSADGRSRAYAIIPRHIKPSPNNAQVKTIVDAFNAAGYSNHSRSSYTLQYVIDYCEAKNIPYRVWGAPSAGYYIEKVTPAMQVGMPDKPTKKRALAKMRKG